MNSVDRLMPMLMSTEQLRSRGMTAQSLRRDVQSGTLLRIRPGFFVEKAAAELDRADRHLLSVLAANAALDRPVFSHASAALIHGLPDWRLPLRKVSVSEESTKSGSRSSEIAIAHRVPDLTDHITSVDGLLVTSPERTVTDVALTTKRDTSVSLADGALRSGLVSPDSLAASLENASGRHGIKRARDAMSLVDAKCESVAETLSRLTFLDHDLPIPETQVEIRNHHGVLVARVDFFWPEFGVIGECDGFGKYFNGRTPTETREQLVKEKDRDAELVALGYRVIHWHWRDIMEPARLAALIRRVLFSTAQ